MLRKTSWSPRVDSSTGMAKAKILLLGRPYFARDAFLFRQHNLRASSADRRETLPHDRKLAEFYNAGPKIRTTRLLNTSATRHFGTGAEASQDTLRHFGTKNVHVGADRGKVGTLRTQQYESINQIVYFRQHDPKNKKRRYRGTDRKTNKHIYTIKKKNC